MRIRSASEWVMVGARTTMIAVAGATLKLELIVASSTSWRHRDGQDLQQRNFGPAMLGNEHRHGAPH